MVYSVPWFLFGNMSRVVAGGYDLAGLVILSHVLPFLNVWSDQRIVGKQTYSVLKNT